MITNIHHRTRHFSNGKTSTRLNEWKWTFKYTPYMQPTWQNIQNETNSKLALLADINETQIGHVVKVPSLFYR